MKSETLKIDPFIASLLPDSDKRMKAVASTSLLVALSLSLLASTYERMIDEHIFEKTETEAISATLDVMNKHEEKKEQTKQEKKPKPKDPENITKRPRGDSGKTRGEGKPNAPKNLGMLALLTSRTKNASAEAYDLINKKFAKDMPKMLSKINGFTDRGKTQIAENRRGKVNAGFNAGSVAGGAGGIDDMLAGILGNGGTSIKTKAKMSNVKVPKPSDIDMGSGGGSRSATDIMKVVRQRTPGLRYIYNKFLKKKPGFQGKVTLKFTIAPGGNIITIGIVSSTTGYAEFDSEIKKAVSSWEFGKIKSGSTTVTIPFTFSE